MLEFLETGPYVTWQDAGRFGLSHLGISAGGAADPVSWRLANLLVGNTAAPALEMTLKGATVRFSADATFALTGADTGATLDDKAVEAWRTHSAKVGQVLKLGICRGGARAYLGISRANRSLFKTSYRLGQRTSLRALAGVDREKFPEPLRGAFVASRFEVTPQSDRNGLRLKGALPAAEAPGERLTEGVLWGTVQVPPSGEPLILMNDQQTTGGYPQLAQVIQADRCLLGQLRPGEQFQFHWVEAEAAVEILRGQNRAVEASVAPL